MQTLQPNPKRKISLPLSVLALIIFCGVRKALENAKPPKSFEGLPITLIAAALTSMTFMGFVGIADKLFG